MSITRSPDIAGLALAFGERTDISARSVLITMFGDSIVPAGGEIWLGDLIDICEPFGFNDRLIRTSMFRLTNENWFETERVGRRSRYRLTSQAIEEFAAAEARIYRVPAIDWDGQWTVVLVGRDLPDDLEATLRWRGFGRLGPGVMALPREDRRGVRRLLERFDAEAVVPVATAVFAELGPLVDADGFAESFGLGEASARYREFIERYRWLTTPALAGAGGREAFLLRTMLVHDLRRPRLADPDLPAELTPARWPAPEAVALAAAGYRLVAQAADDWIAGFDGLEPSTAAREERFSQWPTESR